MPFTSLPLKGEKVPRTSIEVKEVSVSSVYSDFKTVVKKNGEEERLLKQQFQQPIASFSYKDSEEEVHGETNFLKIEDIANSKGDIYIHIPGRKTLEAKKEAFSVIEMVFQLGKTGVSKLSSAASLL